MKAEIIKQKIFNEFNNDLSRKIAYWKFRNFNIVFTNGCFDVLHRGHAEYLSKASELGNILIVGLNTDDSVKRIKGKDRPINNEVNRAFLLSCFSFIDAVVLFNEDTPEELIKNIKPDFLVKGADYSEENIVGASFVKSYGGKIATIDLVPGLSSTGIINSLKK